jgi:hypothetical protein
VRRIAAFAVVALAALLAAAVAVGASGDPKRAITKADQASAKAMLLTRGDLGGGWSVSATSGGRGDDVDFRCPGYQPDESDLTLTGDATSPDFELATAGTISFGSSIASLYATAPQAKASWARVVKPGLVRCFVRLLEDEVGAQQQAQGTPLALEITASGRVAFPAVASRTSAYRISGVVTQGQLTIPMHLDIVLLGSGRANGGFIAVSLFKPFARAAEVRLARITAARMTKAQR